MVIPGIHNLFPHGENSQGLDQDPTRGPDQGPDLDPCLDQGIDHGLEVVAGINSGVLAFH